MSLEPLSHEVFGGEMGIVNIITRRSGDYQAQHLIPGILMPHLERSIKDANNNLARVPDEYANLSRYAFASRSVREDGRSMHFIKPDPTNSDNQIAFSGINPSEAILSVACGSILGGQFFSAKYESSELVEFTYERDNLISFDQDIQDFNKDYDAQIKAEVQAKSMEFGGDLNKWRIYALEEIFHGNREHFASYVEQFILDDDADISTYEEELNLWEQATYDHISDRYFDKVEEKAQSRQISSSILSLQKVGGTFRGIINFDGHEITIQEGAFDQDFTVGNGEVKDTYRLSIDGDNLKIMKRKLGGRIIIVTIPMVCDVEPLGFEETNVWISKMQKYSQAFRREESFDNLDEADTA